MTETSSCGECARLRVTKHSMKNVMLWCGRNVRWQKQINLFFVLRRANFDRQFLLQPKFFETVGNNSTFICRARRGAGVRLLMAQYSSHTISYCTRRDGDTTNY